MIALQQNLQSSNRLWPTVECRWISEQSILRSEPIRLSSLLTSIFSLSEHGFKFIQSFQNIAHFSSSHPLAYFISQGHYIIINSSTLGTTSFFINYFNLFPICSSNITEFHAMSFTSHLFVHISTVNFAMP